MQRNQMSDKERKIYGRLFNETKPERDRHRLRVIIVSIGMGLLILYLIGWYWMRHIVACSTSLLIGGQFYVFYGALLLAVHAFSQPARLTRMSMTKRDANADLFAALMNSRLTAKFAIGFILGGFLIQVLTIVVSEILSGI